jgi:hypothetical protein
VLVRRDDSGERSPRRPPFGAPPNGRTFNFDIAVLFCTRRVFVVVAGIDAPGGLAFSQGFLAGIIDPGRNVGIPSEHDKPRRLR